jgi:hypothetical protein
MYGLERYAVFFGFTEIEGHDWYREGAEELLSRQKKSGSWGNLEQTAFAILFLRRATFSLPEERIPVAPGEGEKPEEPRDPPPRPRPAKEVPALREWLLAGPYPAPTPREDDMLFTQDFDVRRAKPFRGGSAGRKKWEAHRSPTDKIEIGKALGGETPWASFYAATWLFAEEETEAVLWFGSDDGLIVWLNGERILFGHHHNHSGNDYYRVPVTLDEGRNLLLIQVENTEYNVHFMAKVSAPDDGPIGGVESSLSPRPPR